MLRPRPRGPHDRTVTTAQLKPAETGRNFTALAAPNRAPGARGALEGVDRPPRRTVPHTVEELCSASTVQVLVVWTPEVRCNYREHEAPALSEQFSISVRIAFADLFGHAR